ncbi:MAG: tannase/feruloyl esterase family alpha/beta hydrolase [Bryobacterales bacterium]|nr:tannase/feruloyl esterase family alpha/beta hydrolase [Bryobacterales bacterium]
MQSQLPAVAVALGALLFSLPAFGASCESLSSVTLPDTTITLAQSVAAGEFVRPPGPAPPGSRNAPDQDKNLPAFCRVAATIKPTSDSDIKIEIWLPAGSTWNNKFRADGNGGWTGSINYNSLAEGLRDGFATAMTDTGHQGGSGSFALGHPEKIIDFGYRAVHEMTVKAKAIIQAYYGQAPTLSLWNGCSAGGKQGLKEAQSFPQDYGAIVAGAPVNDSVGRAFGAMWIAQAVHQTEASYIPPEKFPFIHKAVLEACDASDGVKDGVIENPMRCRFDPATIACKGAEANDCLTSAQVETARKIYSGVIHARTKEVIFPGLMPGSELGWATQAGPRPFGAAADYFRFIVFKNPDWDYKTLNFDTDVALAYQDDHDTINATNADLTAFFKRGGKILQYQGWSDQQVSAGNSPKYYNSVLEKMGDAAKLAESYRLFMVPGMGHCGGGEGTDTFDKIGALEQWVTTKKAPDQIVASRVIAGKVVRTRPLCPYPQIAVYKGSGSTDEAANFSCEAGAR